MRRAQFIALILLIVSFVSGNAFAGDVQEDEIESLKKLAIRLQIRISDLAEENYLLEQRLELLEELEQQPAFRLAALHQQLESFESAVNVFLDKREYGPLNSMALNPIMPGDAIVSCLSALESFEIERLKIRLSPDNAEAFVTMHFLASDNGVLSVYHADFPVLYSEYVWKIDFAQLVEFVETCEESQIDRE